jgi:hypothetical protein
MDRPPQAQEPLLAAARAVRGHLPDLAGQRAAALDRELARLLELARGGQAVEEQMVAALERDRRVHRWVAMFLAHDGPPPPNDQATRTTESGPPGLPDLVMPWRYACPEADFDWYAADVGEPVPSCPTHRRPLQAVRG